MPASPAEAAARQVQRMMEKHARCTAVALRPSKQPHQVLVAPALMGEVAERLRTMGFVVTTQSNEGSQQLEVRFGSVGSMAGAPAQASFEKWRHGVVASLAMKTSLTGSAQL